MSNTHEQRESRPLITLEGVTRRYRQNGGTQTVLENCTMDFAEGQCHVLLGRSGSGKSTLLNLLGGIDAPDAGTITVGGRMITAMDEEQLTLYRRRDVGTVFQFFYLLPTLTVLENITLPMELDGRRPADLRARAMELLARVELQHKADVMPETLSGGEQQRVAIVRALAHDPLLVLADEPTGNLDRSTGEQVLTLLLELTRETGKTLVMATHSHETLPFADRIYEVHDRGLLPIDLEDVLRQERVLQERARNMRREMAAR
jgi:putative ABC transport system ATP-binding protein